MGTNFDTLIRNIHLSLRVLILTPTSARFISRAGVKNSTCKRVFPINIEQGPTIVSQPSSCVAQCHLVCHSIT